MINYILIALGRGAIIEVWPPQLVASSLFHYPFTIFAAGLVCVR